LPEVQCPVGRHEAHWQSACCQCVPLRVKGARSHAPPRVRQGVMNPPNGTNGPPTPCDDVQYESSAGWPTGCEPYGHGASLVVSGRESRPHGQQGPPAKGSRLPRDRVVRYARGGEPHRSCTVSTRVTGEPDDAKVSCPVRRGAGRKGGDIRPRLRPTLPRFQPQLRPGVSPLRAERVRMRESKQVKASPHRPARIIVLGAERSGTSVGSSPHHFHGSL
jgi:hypothetical protein